MILEYEGKKPEIHPTCFVAESADVIGDVVIGEHSSVWFRTVVRGDVNFIRIGKYTNIQDGCILHVTHDIYPLCIGDFVTVGHGAVLHGCNIQSNVLVGLGAIVMDDAEVGEQSIVAAGCLVTEGLIIPPRSLVMGVPGKVIRELSEEEVNTIGEYADHYYRCKEIYRKQGPGGGGK